MSKLSEYSKFDHLDDSSSSEDERQNAKQNQKATSSRHVTINPPSISTTLNGDTQPKPVSSTMNETKKPTYLAMFRRLHRFRPKKIQDLWKVKNCTTARFGHMLSDLLFDWATEEEICCLLRDKKELTSITFDLMMNLVSLGSHHMQYPLPSNSMVLVPKCDGCSSPCDAGFSACSKHQLVRTNDMPILHEAVLQMTVLSQLMTHPESDLLATIMTAEFPAKLNDADRCSYIYSRLDEKIPQG